MDGSAWAGAPSAPAPERSVASQPRRAARIASTSRSLGMINPSFSALYHPHLYCARGSEPLPVAASLQLHDPPESRRWKMARRHQDLFALQALDERAASLAGQIGIHVGPRHPVG